MKRTILKIDETKCNGCGLCIPNCPEGALKIVNGKARLAEEALCDGLGACLGHCPEGAMTVEVRETEAYDESKVLRQMLKENPEAVQGHLRHLKDHGETGYLKTAMATLRMSEGGGCPGSRSMTFKRPPAVQNPAAGSFSTLTHWPIQLHLLNPAAGHFKKSDLLLAADCTAFSLGRFHENYLQGKTLAIACPKLDDGQEVYLKKLVELIDQSEINTLTVMTMVVPCCDGLLHLAQLALERTSRKIPLKHVLIDLNGTLLHERWLLNKTASLPQNQTQGELS